MTFACLKPLLIGCASFSSSTPFPPLPEHLRACADRVPVTLPEGPWTVEDVANVIAYLRSSELSQDRCANQLKEWYEDVSGTVSETEEPR